MDLIVFIVIIGLTYTTGSIIEKNHYKKIKNREIMLIKKPYLNFGKNIAPAGKINKIRLVTGEAVISGDYFKNFVTGIKNLFGGKLTPFESIMDRARREALIRMRESAQDADVIVNVKIESVMLNPLEELNSIPKCSVIAYGTAVTYER